MYITRCKDIFGLKGLNFSGFADFWWEDHSSFLDKDGDPKLDKDDEQQVKRLEFSIEFRNNRFGG